MSSLFFNFTRELRWRLEKAGPGSFVPVTRALINDLFPQPSPIFEAMMIVSFTVKGHRPPPLQQKEQIEVFCEAQGLDYRWNIENDTYEFMSREEKGEATEQPPADVNELADALMKVMKSHGLVELLKEDG